jgi:uncharacterized protein (TIGR04141 family)
MTLMAINVHHILDVYGKIVLMSSKRSNNAIWKITLPDEVTPEQRIGQIKNAYNALVSSEPSKYKPLSSIAIQQNFEGITLELYVRSRHSQGFLPFVNGYLQSDEDSGKFSFTSKDVCLFIATGRSLFVITSGSGYRIIEGFVDYSFPFDTAKKLVANNFQAADTRDFTGATTSRTETYRRGYSIAKSESFGKAWKRLVGRLNSGLLPDDSYLRELIGTKKPPMLEIKSSFTLKKSLDLLQIVALIQEVESLPEPSEEQSKQLSFLDNLYPVNNKDVREKLYRCLIEELRQEMLGESSVDIDVGDPEDIPRYYAGSDFRISRQQLDGIPPTKDDVIDALKILCQGEINDQELFYEKIKPLKFRYSVDDDDHSPPVSADLIGFLHGQADCNGETFFLLDKVWYRSQGQFLDNLKRDFIEEVFNANSPILLNSDLGILEWSDIDEDAFNRRQASEADYYYGDKIFAVSDRGKIELFDLLRVDEADNKLYVIHVKDGFDAKMRDACSQITIASEVIKSDLENGKVVLSAYYNEWTTSDINQAKSVSREEFLRFFDMDIVYCVICSTRVDFVPQSFEVNRLRSHIARREVLATNIELKGHGLIFRLVHTKRLAIIQQDV